MLFTHSHIHLISNLILLDIPKFKEIIEGIREVLRLIYGDTPPSRLLQAIGYILLGGLALLGLLGLLMVLSKIKDLWMEKFWPLLYNKEKKRRALHRSKFADHIESEIRRLNNLEEWKDYRFADLEAEVDVETRRLFFGFFPSFESRTTIKREKSLSKALRKSHDRLILIEGDPGSGKSVALRHVAQEMARKAMHSRRTESIIPLYINLKELERVKKEKVDRNLIHAFILKTLNRINDRDIEEFLEEEFDQGIKDKTWFFLFDSFDEIPEILSSTEADLAIQEYAQAISDFLHGLNSCRGVLASRYFRGPKQFGWPRFRILPLSEKRRRELVHKARLKAELEKVLLGRLESTGLELKAMASNPMFLSLLCAHMRTGEQFPENSYTVFESYISSRFRRDEGRVKKHFNLKVSEIRTTAELVAFCMAADQHLGLSPTREHVKDAALDLHVPLSKDVDKHLNALEYIKIARSETATTAGESQHFTFAHRRFQEYFATSVVLKEPDRVTARQLLLDARWRETAVVLCQTQPPEVLQSLIKEAEQIVRNFGEAASDPHQQQINEARAQLLKRFDKVKTLGYNWPPKFLHVLGLLQEGFARRLPLLPGDLRVNIGQLLKRASRDGSRADKKSALDVSGTVPAPVLTELLREGFEGTSAWLRESAFLQVARLAEIPKDISDYIRGTLILFLIEGQLQKNRLTIHSHLSRLHKSDFFISLLNLLLWLPRIDLILHIISFALILALAGSIRNSPYYPHDESFSTSLIIYALLTTLSYFIFRVLPAYTTSRYSIEQTRFVSTAWYISVLRGGLLYLSVVLQLINLFSLPFWMFCLILYSFMWAPLTLGLVSSYPKKIHFALWPLLPVIAILRGLKYIIVSSINDTRDYFSRVSTDKYWSEMAAKTSKIFGEWKENLFITSVFVLFMSVAIGGMGGITFLTVSYPRIMLPLLIMIALIVGAYLLFPLFADALTWRRWEKMTRSPITAETFIQLQEQYYTGVFKLRFIKSIRNESLISVSYDSIALIEVLGWMFERMSREVEEVSAAEIIGKSSLDLNNKQSDFKIYFILATQFWKRNSEIIDETYKLLDQMKAKLA